MSRILSFTSAAALAAVIVPAAASQLQIPSDWKVRLDDQGSVTSAAEPKPGEMTFVGMPPGWHITTAGPAAVLYHPDYQGRGNFVVEAEIFLFPGESQEEYGVFLGGQHLETVDKPYFISFVARRDGRVAVHRVGGTSPIVGWRSTEGLTPHPGKDAVKNVLRVDVGPREIVFSVNGTQAITLPRAGLPVEGHFGFRVGPGMNLHASRLDIMHRLAPTK